MSRWRDDPLGAADALIVDSLDDLALPEGRVIEVEGGPRLAAALARRDAVHVHRRLRRSEPFVPVAWPPPAGPFAAGLLRLPKDKRELMMTGHLIASRLAPCAPLFVYGGNDEGVRSVGPALADLGPSQTIAAHSHGRIVRVAIDAPSIRGAMNDWRDTRPIDLGDGVLRDWVSYPGVFSSAGIDAGTALLLANLPPLPASAHVLDFACGTGVIGAAMRVRDFTIDLTGIDNDALALVSAAQNIPNAAWLGGTSLSPVAGDTFDLIVSNPPFHDGVRETTDIIDALIATAPKHLRAGGQICLVTQRRFSLKPRLAASFKGVTAVADSGPYRVWHASCPITPPPTRR